MIWSVAGFFPPSPSKLGRSAAFRAGVVVCASANPVVSNTGVPITANKSIARLLLVYFFF